jgi:TupA-like ATPgrasp
MTHICASGTQSTRPTQGVWQSPQPQTRIWSSLLKALRRRTRWSSLGVAFIMMGKLGLLAVTGKWPSRAVKNTMRGIDFYPWQDLFRAIIHGAHRFKAENGYLPRLVWPVNFNEHIFRRKFLAALPMPSLADKLSAKEYVKARLGDELVPETMWIGDDVEDLFSSKLPPGRYVLKANHGCEWNMFLELPGDLIAKRAEINQKTSSWLRSRYGYAWGEWHYSTFRPRLFLERFIDFNGPGPPEDYKFLCFHGKARLIEVDVDRSTELKSAFYTPNWKYIPVTYGETPIHRPRPRNLEKMVRVAEALAHAIEFVRVDLYSDANSKVVVGEMTFFPGDAGLHFSDLRLDQWLGSQFNDLGGQPFPWDC